MHSHSFKKEDWPFDFDDNVLAVTTKFVMSGQQPIVEVIHWEDGDWQFMCNTTENPDDGMVICMGCLFERFPWIERFKSLNRGFRAYLDEVPNEWLIEKID